MICPTSASSSYLARQSLGQTTLPEVVRLAKIDIMELWHQAKFLAGLKILSRRSSRVRIPYPALSASRLMILACRMLPLQIVFLRLWYKLIPDTFLQTRSRILQKIFEPAPKVLRRSAYSLWQAHSLTELYIYYLYLLAPYPPSRLLGDFISLAWLRHQGVLA